ncbi:MAG: hypothetical protein JWL71_2300 [Acidobacteria bacterium]|nr:hypothetical protein [Acidobacteriota bacterium]
MLVYGHHTVGLNVAAFLRQFRDRLDALPTAPGHDAIVDLLVDWGEAESAVADALLPDRDDDLSALTPWRNVSDACADAACASWDGDAAASAAALARARHGVDALNVATVPEHVRSKAAEGFAHYALFPEQYMDAARRFAREHQPRAVLCLGLRSIGSILAHVVAAAIRRAGIAATTRSVRPRGHPFDRRLAITDRLAAVIADAGVSHVAVVDEGPGLSGSSFAAAADFLVAGGRPADRVVLFPSWLPAGDSLRSTAAQRVWDRHQKITAGFEQVCLRDDRLFGTIPVTRDLSAGGWRAHCFSSPDLWPAVQPQHERRKYLAGSSGTIVRFAGLGRRGRSIADRAAALGESEFGSGALSLTHGWLEQPWIDGRTLTAADAAAPRVLDHLAAYLASIRRAFTTADPESVDEVLNMAIINASEGLGAWTAAPLARLAAAAEQFAEARVAVDGRMLPHEWIAAGDRFVKTDALDHHDDDFWPGCRDIAWDVAGTIAEFDLAPDAAAYFVTAYTRHAGDHTIAQRLPFFEAAYLAYRQAYAAFAGDTLGDSVDGRAFNALRQRYRRSLDERLRRWGRS